MAVLNLKVGSLSLRVSTAGGLIVGFWKDDENGRVPLLRDAPAEADALSSSCYPLVPFGNRVKGNRFAFDGLEYHFSPNTEWDPHYLHGEGWQSEWSLDEQADDRVVMSFAHQPGGHTPYAYRARQTFMLTDDGLELTLSVENAGENALPFGLGWHPYFPLTPETMLLAPARKFWTEVEGWLPGEATEIPADLDFSEPLALPQRWVNNGFEQWSGEATIFWPEHGTKLHLTADPIFRHAFIFVSDTDFDPQFKRDYFCFEPMSHLANSHNMPDLGDLQVLKPGQRLSGSIRLRPQDI
ncbi:MULTISPECIES: aldose 1-epimerase [unclassified Rhizobium]|uniref:aldose 1-epimerase n=1 Tax=unclassified Rhizobium TaxID=2613769 RepID=UPI001AE82733|nr:MULTISPECIES: aldose 1-epimerase [unclassified Rhizobium]MBP2463640.1 aldose 1-epimerase [Rhizobium sp. PvP014]MBP2532162.1 aldose 1-epimerase [Rhizobium sp. PvP099]